MEQPLVDDKPDMARKSASPFEPLAGKRRDCLPASMEFIHLASVCGASIRDFVRANGVVIVIGVVVSIAAISRQA